MTNTINEQIEVDLRGRDFLSLVDFSYGELTYLIDLAISLKEKQKAGEVFQPLKGKTLGMIFEKSSTRTRVSFEVGMYQLGGHALFLSGNDLQIGRGETIWDTAQVMSRYIDGLMIRTFAHRNVIELARGATVPVINGLTDLYHPCQALADYQTIFEKKGKLRGLKLAYVGDGNNMAHSLMEGASKLGVNIAIATPEGYAPDPEVTAMTKEHAKLSGSTVSVGYDLQEAVSDADIIYTDVWASMGFEEEKEQRIAAFKNFQVDQKLAKLAKKDYIFMHCLPAHRGEEVSEDVIDGPHSIIYDQAENRLHAQKAIMAAML